MTSRSPASTTSADHPNKRARHASPELKVGSPPNGNASVVEEKSGKMTTTTTTSTTQSSSGSSSSNFRNVSACNRCRLRKNRCDQRLPSCASCEKASVKCVGYDPITKREIPRSYVFYLETRIGYLEKVLRDHNITFASADVLDHASRPGPDPNLAQTPSDDVPPPVYSGADSVVVSHKQSPQQIAWNRKLDESERINKMVSSVGSIPVQGASDSRYLGSTSGISFARVVFAAVKSSVSESKSDKSGVRPSRPSPSTMKAPAAGGTGTSMRDSFFGLHTKPTIKQAPFPSKEVALRLVIFYFEHSNPQVPVLHRGEFMKMFESAYAEGDARVRTPRELYMLNIVFAIGSGVFLGDSGEREQKHDEDQVEKNRLGVNQQSQPEEYHASAIVHLESCLSAPASSTGTDGFGGGLEELQAVLLLAGFALLRPVAPGLWYIIGVAVRLAVDLGLHYEDGKDIDVGLDEASDVAKAEDSNVVSMTKEKAARERGRREWVRDFRRRLWWCTYSLDRLVSTCVGRPFGITDQVITTEFPTLLDDKYITPNGFLEPPPGEPTYKHISYHYFRLRLLQSEILQVLQHQQAQQARMGGTNSRNPFMFTSLPSPFLSKFDSFRSWRIDIDRRLYEWKTSAPTKRDTGVWFSVEFLDLNYWQCVIMLYRQSLSVPPMFEGEFNTSNEVGSPSMHNVELIEDEERVFLKVAEAGQRVLRLYRQLHRVHLVNYTFLATHHLFMAGISFLYAIWHSSVVRSRLTMDEVDFTILAATSVLGDLIEKCPPAEACRDAFDRMSKATVQMCMSTTGFGSSATPQGGQGLHSQSQSRRRPHHSNASTTPSSSSTTTQSQSNIDYFPHRNGSKRSARPKPQFDMGLNDLLNSRSPPAPPPSYRPASRTSTGSNGVKMEMDGYTSTNGTGRQPNQPPTPSDYAISPPLSSLDTSAIDPSLLPSPSQSQPANQNYYNPYPPVGDLSQIPFQNAPGMDFLNNGWGDGTSSSGGGGGGAGEFQGDMGLGIGGLGWDGVGDHHDFSEGGNGGVDLFDGFFFGGSGNF